MTDEQITSIFNATQPFTYKSFARAILDARRELSDEGLNAERYLKWVSYSGFTKEHCDSTLDAIEVNQHMRTA